MKATVAKPIALVDQVAAVVSKLSILVADASVGARLTQIAMRLTRVCLAPDADPEAIRAILFTVLELGSKAALQLFIERTDD